MGYPGAYNTSPVYQNYTPTLTNFGTTGTAIGTYWTNGDRLNIEFLIASTGTGTASGITMTMPPGYSIDTSKLPSAGVDNQSVSIIGFGQWFDLTSAFMPIQFKVNSTVQVGVVYSPGLLLGSQLTPGDSVKGRVEVPYKTF